MMQSKRFKSMFGLSVGLLGLAAAWVLTLATVPAASAGAVGGMRTYKDILIQRGQTKTYTVEYHSGYSTVSVSAPEIKIRVYDSNGNLVASNNGNARAVNWGAQARGFYRIEFTFQPTNNLERTRFTWHTN